MSSWSGAQSPPAARTRAFAGLPPPERAFRLKRSMCAVKNCTQCFSKEDRSDVRYAVWSRTARMLCKGKRRGGGDRAQTQMPETGGWGLQRRQVRLEVPLTLTACSAKEKRRRDT
eukprot:4846257-Pyramimonas_sp.AAC.1